MSAGPDKYRKEGLKDLEQIRSRLRALGYLESPVERFLVPRGGSPWRMALRVTFRASLLAGALLSGLTTSSTLIADPAFIGNLRDVVLFALYMGLVYGLCFFLLLYLPAYFWLRKGARSTGIRVGGNVRSALLSGFAAGVLCLYLLGWWYATGFNSRLLGPLSPLAIGVFVTIALASLMAGRLAGFVYFLLAGVPARSIGRRSAVARSYFASALVILIIEGGWFVGISRYRPSDQALAVALEHQKVPPLPAVLIGLDGLDAGTLVSMAESDSLPNLARLINEGFLAELLSDEQYLAPQVWNTVSTGVTPERHGINYIMVPTLRGLSRQPRLFDNRPGLEHVIEQVFPFFKMVRSVPVSAAQRRSKTVWEIVELFGIPTGVVNWWASWPARPSNGFTVSERTFPKMSFVFRDEGTKPSAYFQQEVFPAGEFDSLALLTENLGDELNSLLSRYSRMGKLLEGVSPGQAKDLIRSVFLSDLFNARVAVELLGKYKVGFLALYFQGPDVLNRLDERSELIEPVNVRTVIPEYYCFLDSLVGEVIDCFGPSTLVVVVADPGKHGRALGRRGALLLHGIDVGKGSRSNVPYRLEDVAPTILYLIGLPVDRGMYGRPCLEAGMPGPGGAPPLHYVVSYGPPPLSRASSLNYRNDQEMIERLRALGYIK